MGATANGILMTEIPRTAGEYSVKYGDAGLYQFLLFAGDVIYVCFIKP